MSETSDTVPQSPAHVEINIPYPPHGYYLVDWEKAKTIEDLIALFKASNPGYRPCANTAPVAHLLKDVPADTKFEGEWT